MKSHPKDVLGSPVAPPAPTSPAAARSVRDAIAGDLDQGRLPAALDRVDRAEAEGTLTASQAALDRASILRAWGRDQEALRALAAVAPDDASDAESLRMRAWAFGWEGRFADAAATWAHVRERVPHATGDSLQQARALSAAGRANDARAIAGQAYALGERDPELVVLLAQLEAGTGQADRAARTLGAGLDHAPDHPALLMELAALEYARYRDAAAIALLDRAREHARDSRERAECSVRMAIGLRRLGRPREGLALLLETLRDEPVLNGHLELGPALLSAGDFPEGWRQFEHRWLVMPLAALRGDYGVPTWTGQSLAGRTLLVRCEQGFGDVFQFARFLPLLKARGARVLLLPLRGLEAMSRRFPGVDEVLREWAPLPPLDYVVDMMSLPVGFATTVDTIPSKTPYLDADPARRERWRLRFAERDGPRVGLVWAGRPEHPNDRRRSLRLEELRPVLEVEGVRFCSLQKGPAAAQAEIVPARIDWEQIGPELDDFEDTAAALESLDLLITVDTGVAHLAGALGRETWTLLPVPAEYRWMGEGAESPWYPTMRLFRQSAMGDWSGVMGAVAHALRAWVAERSSGVTRAAEAKVPSSAHPSVPGVPRAAPGARALARAARMRAGFLQYLPDDPVGSSLECYGEWAEPLLARMLRLVPPGAVLLESGSGVGAHTLRLAHATGPEGRVLAWEDDARSQRVLAINVEANVPGRVTLMRRSLRGAGGPFDARQESVDDLRLTELAGVVLQPSADARAVVSGAVETIWRCRPWIAFLAHAKDDTSEAWNATLDMGYRVGRWRASLHQANNFNRQEVDRHPGQQASLVLAVPEERPVGTLFDDAEPPG